MTNQSSHAIADARVVIKLVTNHVSIKKFGDKKHAASTGAESDVNEHTEVASANDRASNGITSGQSLVNA